MLQTYTKPQEIATMKSATKKPANAPQSSCKDDIRIFTSVSPNVYKKLKEMAAKDNRSMANMVRVMLADAVQ